MIKVVNKRIEPNHIYCGRGSALGNPFPMNSEKDRDMVCDKYEEYFNQKVRVERDARMIAQLKEILRQAKIGDVNLGCFCAPKRCHCDTIKRFIENQPSMARIN